MRRWPFRIHLRERCCARATVASSRRLIRSSAARQACVFGLAHDHVQADAEAQRAAVAAARWRTSATFFATAAGGSPQVR
jgi:hypothetical protein